MGSCFSAESRSPLSGSPLSPHPAFDYRKKRNSRKKSGSVDFRKEEQLHRIPGRLFLNGSSGVASLYTQQGKKGTNQDAMIVWENFGSRTDMVFCGVFDGHCPYGHMVAKKVRDHLPLKLSAHWEVNISSEDVLRGISLNTAGSVNSEETALISADEESRASVDLDVTEKNPEIWDVLSNKEMIDIIASAPACSSAARTLVQTAVQAWRYKYPTSKVDDCAVVCLFLDSNLSNLSYASNTKAKVQLTSMDHINNETENVDSLNVLTSLNWSGTVRTDKEEDSSKFKQEEVNSELGLEWSALEGVSRVDTLLNLPRFVPGKEDEKAWK